MTKYYVTEGSLKLRHVGILELGEFYTWLQRWFDFEMSWNSSNEKYYEEVKQAYVRVFDRLGLPTLVTEASGGSFSDKISYEFEVLCDAGEANLVYCDSCKYCLNVDDLKTHGQGDVCPRCKDSKLTAGLGAEVGNIFDLGLKYTKAFDLTYIDIDGARKYPFMGCYGIGVSRTMGVLVEKFHDERGIMWPREVAPFQVHFVNLRVGGDTIYKKLVEAGVDVLWDDTDRSAGQKLADADLIGIPVRLVVSEKTGEKVEWKERTGDKTELLSLEEVTNRLK